MYILTALKIVVVVEVGSHVRVNKDDLRSMLHNSIYSESNEKFVLSVRDFAVEECLKKNLSELRRTTF